MKRGRKTSYPPFPPLKTKERRKDFVSRSFASVDRQQVTPIEETLISRSLFLPDRINGILKRFKPVGIKKAESKRSHSSKIGFKCPLQE